MFDEMDLTTTDVRELVSATPVASKAVVALYDTYRKTQMDVLTLTEQVSDEAGALLDFESQLPAERVSDFIQEKANHFPDIEEEAERIRRDARLDARDPFNAMVDYIQTAFGVRVTVLPPAPGAETARRYDPTHRTLEISERLARHSRIFQLAHQLGLIAAGSVFEMLLNEGGLTAGEARRLGQSCAGQLFRVGADHALRTVSGKRQGATLRHRAAAASFRHQFRAGLPPPDDPAASRPQGCALPHAARRYCRQCLQALLHIGPSDSALWRGLSALERLRRLSVARVINAQISVMPDKESYFCIARTVHTRAGGYGAPQSFLSIGLGCEISHGRELVYADGIDLDNSERRNSGRRSVPDLRAHGLPPTGFPAGLSSPQYRRECARPVRLCVDRTILKVAANLTNRSAGPSIAALCGVERAWPGG